MVNSASCSHLVVQSLLLVDKLPRRRSNTREICMFVGIKTIVVVWKSRFWSHVIYQKHLKTPSKCPPFLHWLVSHTRDCFSSKSTQESTMFFTLGVWSCMDKLWINICFFPEMKKNTHITEKKWQLSIHWIHWSSHVFLVAQIWIWAAENQCVVLCCKGLNLLSCRTEFATYHWQLDHQAKQTENHVRSGHIKHAFQPMGGSTRFDQTWSSDSVLASISALKGTYEYTREQKPWVCQFLRK